MTFGFPYIIESKVLESRPEAVHCGRGGPFHWWAPFEDDEVMRRYFYWGTLSGSKGFIFVLSSFLREESSAFSLERGEETVHCLAIAILGQVAEETGSSYSSVRAF